LVTTTRELASFQRVLGGRGVLSPGVAAGAAPIFSLLSIPDMLCGSLKTCSLFATPCVLKLKKQ